MLHRGVPMPDVSGPDLIARAQRGDVDAIGALYDMHYRAIFRYLRARVGDQQLAEDLTGDVFRRMLTGVRQYRPMGCSSMNSFKALFDGPRDSTGIPEAM